MCQSNFQPLLRDRVSWNLYSGPHNNRNNLTSVPPSVQEWCFKWKKPFTLIEWRLLKSRVQTELVWCHGHGDTQRADYNSCKSHWYAQTLRWSMCLQSDAHTHTHMLRQMWTCQTEMNTNQNKACKHKSDPENEEDREKSTVPSVKQM